ncbi:non-specific serine/threonine protein kinase [Entamoeba marina]
MNRLKIFNRKKSDNKEVSVIDPADIKKGDPINTNGPLGDVYRCLSRKSKSAVKYFNKADSSFSTTFLKETESLKKIFHPNIILMMGVVVNKPQAIVMEVMKCNLYHVIYEPTKCPKTLQNMTDLNKFKILRDVSVGLTFIHNFAKIPHGNLKLTNILF